MAPERDTITKDDVEVIVPGSSVLSRLGEMQRELAPMIDMIPDAGGDGEVNILEAIMRAETIEEIDAAWEARSLEDYVGQKLTITGLRKGKSDFADGLGLYLLIDALDEAGKKLVLTTGSVSCVGQLIKANALGAFPRTFIPRKAERASANGFFPMHLELAR
jgi:hypothetical protein